MTAARPMPRPATPAGVSMRDLLASCAAADAVSQPPRAPEPRRGPEPVTARAEDRPRAA
ncbi:hypothetical protein [Streptomyces dangxiongensis]|uniref:hypothetical protein n=1 Tax=Streptomyces dangxiongensis TaxID=1442032 RepID=UPI0013CEAFBA|nr:hypothetical protein [Streptomyces dangxiongensis]